MMYVFSIVALVDVSIPMGCICIILAIDFDRLGVSEPIRCQFGFLVGQINIRPSVCKICNTVDNYIAHITYRHC